MRVRAWGWNPSGRRRWGILALWLGHVLWVFLGRNPVASWEKALGVLSRPSQIVSARLENWKYQRGQRAGNHQAAEAEIKALRQRVEYLQTTAIADIQKITEAEEAVRLLGLKRQLPLETRGARVIANLRNAPFGGLVLDQGEDIGLVPDQGVICPEGVVGRIWSVVFQQASVLPLDAFNASTAVMLARSRATGVLQGVAPGKAEIRYIGRQEAVQVGEPVFTSGLDRVFPRGLLVGYVTAVKPRDQELSLEVALAAPLDRVHLVLVLPAKPPMQIQPPSAPPPQLPVRGGK
ncbi:MAG: rod shape-determining protein MreC [Holophaga sp.]|nr:rod shape-determining protein MreC [Holophaga sp.]